MRLKLIRPNTSDTIFFAKYNVPVDDWKFNGRVQNIWSDSKGYFFVIVNGNEYDLDPVIWNLTFAINKGDLIFKRRGESIIKVIKANRQDTLEIKKIKGLF